VTVTMPRATHWKFGPLLVATALFDEDQLACEVMSELEPSE
jgi:hypothetical protein